MGNGQFCGGIDAALAFRDMDFGRAACGDAFGRVIFGTAVGGVIFGYADDDDFGKDCGGCKDGYAEAGSAEDDFAFGLYAEAGSAYDDFAFGSYAEAGSADDDVSIGKSLTFPDFVDDDADDGQLLGVNTSNLIIVFI